MHIKERKRQRWEREALMSNHFWISHCWYDVEKLTVPGSGNLNLSFSLAQEKVLCEKNERKMCYILFY